MEFLPDTNILMRQADRRSPERVVVLRAIDVLERRGDSLILAPQHMYEFWAVATRPQAVNGLGLSIEEAENERIRLESLFELRPDPLGLYQRWVSLVNSLRISGKQVHDARLAAFMLEYDIPNILTFNVTDFVRFPGIIAVHPSSL